MVRSHNEKDLFISMKCDLNWTEIVENLLLGSTLMDRQDLVASVFKQKKVLFNNMFFAYLHSYI